jgi:hypothetical protein
MRYSTLGKAVALVTVVGALALLAPGRAEAVVVNWKFGLAGVVFDAGQALQVNASHSSSNEDAPFSFSCDARVEFLDGATGASLKTADLTVPSGQTRSADLGVTELVPLKGKVPIYVRATIDDPNTRPACGRPSLEVFDKATGRTAAGIWNPGDRGVSEAFFPAFTLVTGLTLRFNAVNYGDPNEAPCPVLLTIFAADGTALQEQRAMLASGVGTFLDAAIGNPDARVQLRATGSRVVGRGDDRTLCRAFVFSVEVYYSATGITTLIIGDPGL